MISGPPLPLRSSFPLSELIAHASGPGTLGAWVHGSARVLHLYETAAGVGRILLSPDLGYLLGRCSRVALRRGDQLIVLEPEVIIQWRALQVATSNPYLTESEQLRVLFPDLQAQPRGLLIPVPSRSPEEVIAQLISRGVPIAESRVVYLH